MLWHFCALIGDYDSMLMLLPNPPEHCPSMKASTVVACLKFKRQEKNTPVMCGGNKSNMQMRDKYNNFLYAEGGWNAPQNEWVYSAAVSALHQQNGHINESYKEACPKCQGMSNRRHGCVHHEGKPQL